MAQVRQMEFEATPGDLRIDVPQDERWPLPKAAAFACLVSMVLWALIISGIAWLV
jgi:hypothetical protein